MGVDNTKEGELLERVFNLIQGEGIGKLPSYGKKPDKWRGEKPIVRRQFSILYC